MSFYVYGFEDQKNFEFGAGRWSISSKFTRATDWNPFFWLFFLVCLFAFKGTCFLVDSGFLWAQVKMTASSWSASPARSPGRLPSEVSHVTLLGEYHNILSYIPLIVWNLCRGLKTKLFVCPCVSSKNFNLLSWDHIQVGADWIAPSAGLLCLFPLSTGHN